MLPARKPSVLKLIKGSCKGDPHPPKKHNAEKQASFDLWKRLCIENFKEYFGKDTRLVNIRFVERETYGNHLKQKLNKRKPSGPMPLSTVRCPAFITYSQRPGNPGRYLINDDLAQVFMEIRKEKQLRSEYMFFRIWESLCTASRGF